MQWQGRSSYWNIVVLLNKWFLYHLAKGINLYWLIDFTLLYVYSITVILTDRGIATSVYLADKNKTDCNLILTLVISPISYKYRSKTQVLFNVGARRWAVAQTRLATLKYLGLRQHSSKKGRFWRAIGDRPNPTKAGESLGWGRSSEVQSTQRFYF